MTSVRRFRVHKIDDRTALETFFRFRELFGGEGELKIRLTNSIAVSYNSIYKKVPKAGTYNIPQIFWDGRSNTSHQQISLEFTRWIDPNTEEISPLFDKFTISFHGENNRWSSSTDEVHAAIKVISGVDLPSPALEVTQEGSALHELMQGIRSSHVQNMADLQEALRNLAEKRAELEESERQQRASHEKAFQEKMLILEEKERSLLLQSHQHERRELTRRLQELTAQFQDQGRRSRHGTLIGITVFLSAFAASIATAYFSFVSVIEMNIRTGEFSSFLNQLQTLGLSQDPTELIAEFERSFQPLTWFIIIKGVLSGTFSVLAFWFAVSWIKRYYDADIQHTEKMQNLRVDVARAAWVLEAIQEIKHEAKAELPKEWTEAVTRDLFSGQTANKEINDGALALRALMGFTANASFGPEGAKFEMNKKNTKALSQAEE